MSQDEQIYPPCPKCGHPMNKNGVIDGVQQWRCVAGKTKPNCGKSNTRDNPKKPGRPSKGEQPMTEAERQRASRAQKKAEGNT
jgi:hypothetical protein